MNAREKMRKKKERQQLARQNRLEQKKQEYRNRVKAMQPKPNVFKNVVWAFFVGGSVCVFGQFLQNMYMRLLDMTPQQAGNPTSATMIFIAALLTGLGVFDHLAKYAGAGLAVPVTGFANSMTASALEFKREGYVLGVGSKMFILAGSVIVFGVLTAFVVGIISALF